MWLFILVFCLFVCFFFWVTELLWETPTYNWSLLMLCWQLFCFFLKVYGWAHSVIFFHSAFPLFSLLFFKLKGQSRAFQRVFFCLYVNKYFWGKGVKVGGFVNGHLRKIYKQRWSFNLKICLTVPTSLIPRKIKSRHSSGSLGCSEVGSCTRSLKRSKKKRKVMTGKMWKNILDRKSVV